MSEIELVDNLTVSGTNCEDAAAPRGFVIPVTSSNLKDHFLTLKLLKEAVLSCAGAIEADLIAARSERYIGIICSANILYSRLDNKYGSGVVNLCIECTEVGNSLIGYEEVSAVVMAAIVVGNNLGITDTGLTEI